MAKIQRKNKDESPKILSAEEQEKALDQVRKPERKLYRHTIDVPADLAAKIEDELKRTHLSKRGFWLKIAEDYFSKHDK